jgi:hypothetical protein
MSPEARFRSEMLCTIMKNKKNQDGGEVQRRNAKIKNPISYAGPSAGVTAV